MKIEEFEFDLEEQEDENELFPQEDQKRFERKMFNSVNKDNTMITEDFEELKELLQKDPERGRILSYLIMRGWLFISGYSPIFNKQEVEEEAQNELLKENI